MTGPAAHGVYHSAARGASMLCRRWHAAARLMFVRVVSNMSSLARYVPDSSRRRGKALLMHWPARRRIRLALDAQEDQGPISASCNGFPLYKILVFPRVSVSASHVQSTKGRNGSASGLVSILGLSRALVHSCVCPPQTPTSNRRPPSSTLRLHLGKSSIWPGLAWARAGLELRRRPQTSVLSPYK